MIEKRLKCRHRTFLRMGQSTNYPFLHLLLALFIILAPNKVQASRNELDLISERYNAPDVSKEENLSPIVLEKLLNDEYRSGQDLDSDDGRANVISNHDNVLEEYIAKLADEIFQKNGDGETYSDWKYPYNYNEYFLRLRLDELYGRSKSNEVAIFLDRYQDDLHVWRRALNLLAWNKETNLTHYNIERYNKFSLKFSNWAKTKRTKAEQFSLRGLLSSQQRMLKIVTRTTALNEIELNKLKNALTSRISSRYSKAKVCKAGGKCYHFEPGLMRIMKDSRSYSELLWAWKGWRDEIGPFIRDDWSEVVQLQNKGAKEHGYNDEGEYLRKLYEDPNFVQAIDALWKDIEPMYKQLHAYVRYKLHAEYGSKVDLQKAMPAHLFGDMWAMKWDALLDRVEPFPEVGGFDVTKGMKACNITTMRMFTLADEFYKSIGLPPMPQSFWEKSMFIRPKDNRSVVCYASAFNLEKTDVRVKMCAVVSADYFYVAHHEMGHCQYYLAYNDKQPEIFQSGANNGFHEAIGDTAALSVISLKHLRKLKILKSGDTTADVERKKVLNFLMQKALGKIAFLPFAMTMAKYKWDIYSGKIKKENLNSAWWQYRKKYQGLVPPIPRTENDFDAGSKYHIANFVPYVRYFVSHVLQFQFYESLCKLADHVGPLYNCDFAGSKKAGKVFQKMLQMGRSKPWPDALEVLTGTRTMSVKPIQRYFEPLITWITAENKRLGNKIGWD